MKNKKERKKLNPIFTFIIGVIMSGTSVYAATTILASDVGFTSVRGLVSRNVQDAIDEVYAETVDYSEIKKQFDKTYLYSADYSIYYANSDASTNTFTSAEFNSLGGTTLLNFTSRISTSDIKQLGTWPNGNPWEYFYWDLNTSQMHESVSGASVDSGASIFFKPKAIKILHSSIVLYNMNDNVNDSVTFLTDVVLSKTDDGNSIRIAFTNIKEVNGAGEYVLVSHDRLQQYLSSYNIISFAGEYRAWLSNAHE